MNDINQSKLSLDGLRLYGREDEVARLKGAYRESSRSCQIVWIYGYGGVGKTTLVQSAFLQDADYYYCYGKFERIRSAQPYSAIVSLLSRLCSILEFGFPAIPVSAEVASILSNILPGTSQVLSYDKAQIVTDNQGASYVMDKKLEWSFEKLKDAIQTFVKGACRVLQVGTAPAPLILHLDDLQWADADSIEIITSLITGCDNMKGLLFIGSYRDNDLDIDSPLRMCKHTIGEAMADKVMEIKLSNLSRSSIDRLVADTTQMSLSLAEPLGQLIYDISLGNAFFAIRLLQHLHDSNLLIYCDAIGRWKWDADKITQELEMRDNVVHFMMRTLKSLPPTTTTALQIAACLGSQVDISLLEQLVQGFEIDLKIHPMKEMLQVAVSAHLIVMDSDETSFKFFHDRIHDAAYSLAETDDQRQSMHLKIGRQLQRIKDEESDIRQWTIVLAVDQLNRAGDLVDDSEKVDLARLNLVAANEVIATSAFKMAQGFLEFGIELLGMTRWSAQYELTLELSNKLAFVLFSNGSMERSLNLIDQIYQQSKCDEDRREVQFLHVEVLASLNRLSECIDTSMSILRQIGHRKIPKNPGLIHIISDMAGVKKLLKNKTDADHLSLPVCHDKRILAIIRHLGMISPVAFSANRPALIPVVTCRMMQLSLQYGLSEFTPYAFGCYGFSLTVTGDFDEAFHFASLALRLMRRLGEDARTLVMVYGLLNHLKTPILDMTAPTLHAYHVAFAHGDLTFAGQAAAVHCVGRFVAGSSLDNLVADIFRFCDQLKAYKQIMTWYILATMQRSCLALIGRSNEMARLTETVLDDTAFGEYLKTSKAEFAEFFFWLQCSMCHYYLGNMDSALTMVEKCWRSKEGLKGAVVYSVTYFLASALIAVEHWRKSAPGPKRFRYWRIFRKYHKELRSWVAMGNPNTRHLVHLLNAVSLSTRRSSTTEAVQRWYDKSIAMARRAGFLNDVALANELAGQYFLSKGDEDWASLYLNRAKASFTDWGALAKVRQMEIKYGVLVEVEISSDQLSHAVIGRSRGDTFALVERSRSGPILSLASRRGS